MSDRQAASVTAFNRSLDLRCRTPEKISEKAEFRLRVQDINNFRSSSGKMPALFHRVTITKY